MSDAVARLAHANLGQARSTTGSADAVSVAVRQVFMLMHGSYGNLFVSKFATGDKDKQGKDRGIRSAMKIWDAKLRAYPADVIEAAAGRLLQECPEFPPNLPQFEALCRAVMPRKTYAETQGLPRLPAPQPAPAMPVAYTARNDGRDWARAILAAVEAGQRRSFEVVRSARKALAIDRMGVAA
jgi:hypothetical protein